MRTMGNLSSLIPTLLNVNLQLLTLPKILVAVEQTGKKRRRRHDALHSRRLDSEPGEARRGGKGNASRRRHSDPGPVDEVPEDFLTLFNQDGDEIDVREIADHPMLSNRPPMTWPA